MCLYSLKERKGRKIGNVNSLWWVTVIIKVRAGSEHFSYSAGSEGFSYSVSVGLGRSKY